MNDYLVTDAELTAVADAIRAKGGVSGRLVFPAGFVSAVAAIPTGGAAADGSKPVLFIDYHGTPVCFRGPSSLMQKKRSMRWPACWEPTRCTM